MGSQAVFIFYMVCFPGLPCPERTHHFIIFSVVWELLIFLHLPTQDIIVLRQFGRCTFIISEVEYHSLCVLDFCVSLTAVLDTIVLDGL